MTRNDGGRKVSTRDPGPRHDSPSKPAGPATPQDGRRETEERLAEGMGGKERHEARKARKEDPSLPDPGTAEPDGGGKDGGGKDGGGKEGGTGRR